MRHPEIIEPGGTVIRKSVVRRGGRGAVDLPSGRHVLGVLEMGHHEVTLRAALECVRRGRGRLTIVWGREDALPWFCGVAPWIGAIWVPDGPVEGDVLKGCILRVPQHVPVVVIECARPYRKRLPKILEREQPDVIIVGRSRLAYWLARCSTATVLIAGPDHS